MSVYIPGIEKSKTCAFCRFCEGLADTQLGSCAFCVVDGKTRVADTPPKDCPLVPVPEHGRLIDADELFKEIGMDGRFGILEAMCIQSIIHDAPTIIQAEEGE